MHLSHEYRSEKAVRDLQAKLNLYRNQNKVGVEESDENGLRRSMMVDYPFMARL